MEEKAECDSGPTEPREPSSECWSRNCSSESLGAPNAPMRYFLREALKNYNRNVFLLRSGGQKSYPTVSAGLRSLRRL